jgi:hypothetical protein
MHGLWIELGGKGDNLRARHGVRAKPKLLPDLEILEIAERHVATFKRRGSIGAGKPPWQASGGRAGTTDIMAQSKATTVEQYLAELPPERQAAIAAVRNLVRRHLPAGYEESMQFGMIAWSVPLSRYPKTYNAAPLMFAALASQKNHMSLYLMCVYAHAGDAERFAEKFRASGKPLDMGKSCIRFRKLDDLPLELIGETIAGTPVEDFIALYETARKRHA